VTFSLGVEVDACSITDIGASRAPSADRVQALDFARPHASPAAGPRRGFRHLEQVVPMKVGVAKETAPGERRVALVPEALGKLQQAGLEILVESGAGAARPSR
jgi:hypothetical protein